MQLHSFQLIQRQLCNMSINIIIIHILYNGLNDILLILNQKKNHQSLGFHIVAAILTFASMNNTTAFEI